MSATVKAPTDDDLPALSDILSLMGIDQQRELFLLLDFGDKTIWSSIVDDWIAVRRALPLADEELVKESLIAKWAAG